MSKKGFIVCVPTIVGNEKQPKPIQNTFYEMKIITLIEIHLIFIKLHYMKCQKALKKNLLNLNFTKCETWYVQLENTSVSESYQLQCDLIYFRHLKKIKFEIFVIWKVSDKKEWWKSTTKFLAFLWEPIIKSLFWK